MELFEQNFEQLEQLASLYERGRISEEEFRELKKKILEGEKVELTDPKRQKGAGHALDLDLLTSCQAANRRARLHNILKHNETLAGSIHAKKFFAQYRRPSPTRAPKELKAALSVTGKHGHGRSLSRLAAEQIKRRGFGESSVVGFFTTVILILGIAAVVFVCQTPGFVSTLQKIKSVTTTAAALARSETKNTRAGFEPLFGAPAVTACKEKCRLKDQKKRELCSRGCDAFSLQIYPRRVAAADSSPVKDAQLIVQRCAAGREQERFKRQDEWLQEVQAGLTLLATRGTVLQSTDPSRIELLYNSLAETNSELRPPPTEDAKQASLTRETAQATCLAANAVLGTMGFRLALKDNDDFSLGYYTRLLRTLNDSSNKMQEQVLSHAAAMKIYPHD